MITRNNYEEYFLLYVDGELGEREKHLVEEWVAENPDLKSELDVLMQCRLDKTDLVYPDKAGLMEIPAGITQEDLLSYIDGELDERRRVLVETGIKQDANWQSELAILYQTINRPDASVVFAEKERLYRRERERRIVAWPLYRVAAAAIVLLLAGGWWFFSGTKKEAAVSQVQGEPSISKATTTKTADPREVVKKRTVPVTSPVVEPLHDTKGAVRKADEELVSTVKIKRRRNERREADDPEPTRMVKTGLNGITQDPVEVRNNNSVDIAQIDGKTPGHGLATAVAEPGRMQGGHFATDALLREEAGSPDAHDLAAGNTESEAGGLPGKKVLRGMFRKVTRVFDKNSDGNEDKHGILIGNLQIALK